MESKIEYKYSPDKEFRFFFYHAGEMEHTYYKCVEDRDEEAAKEIRMYLDDGYWMEDIDDCYAGEVIVTHRVQKTDVIKRPDDVDEDGVDGDGNWWDSEWQEMCDYGLVEV